MLISHQAQLVMHIFCVVKQKAAWFESDFCLSCVSSITTQLRIENFAFVEYCEISTARVSCNLSTADTTGLRTYLAWIKI